MSKKYNKRVLSIKPTSIAMLQGTFTSILGLAAAIMFSLNKTVDIADSTNSLLAGLTLGLTAGALAIIIVPLVYFAIGWLIGLVQGYVINFIIESAGGVEVRLDDNNDK